MVIVIIINIKVEPNDDMANFIVKVDTLNIIVMITHMVKISTNFTNFSVNIYFSKVIIEHCITIVMVFKINYIFSIVVKITPIIVIMVAINYNIIIDIITI